MAKIQVNQHTYEADLLVFDKDGLMFECEQFWIEMENSRLRSISKYCNTEMLKAWAKLMGARTEEKEGRIETTWVDPVGILAIAPPTEEVVILAAFLMEKLGMVWQEARDLAAKLFVESDAGIDLRRALKPQPGYVELMQQINRLNIPYGVATSDNYDRTKDSMSMYNCWKNVRFVVTSDEVPRGKPYPDMLEYISKKQKVPLDRMVMIGDSYVDVKMAKSAGSIGIGVTTSAEMKEKMKPYATEIIDSLEFLKVSND